MKHGEDNMQALQLSLIFTFLLRSPGAKDSKPFDSSIWEDA
jgi:hypothetical protein